MRIASLLACLLVLGSPAPIKAAEKLDGIVLVIADGTSLELITAARLYSGGREGHLAIDQFPRAAFVHTYSDSDLVTDSGAAATAMARGIKADNRVIGVAGPSSTSGPPSILDIAKEAGWSTAVITDDAVTGATPAAFLVEHGNRSDYGSIAGKILGQLGKRADFVIGGGSKWFIDQSADPNVVYDGNDRDLARKNQERIGKLPITVIDSWERFQAFQPEGDAPVLGILSPDQFSFYADGLRAVRLKDIVKKTVGMLQKRGKPFFLMVEAGLPDKACHLNNAKRAIAEVQEFDATLDWLRNHLGHRVLLLATTDHNTGGLTINGPPLPSRLSGDALLGTNPVTGYSYLTWASGPGADRENAVKRTAIVAEPGKPLTSRAETVRETDVDYTQPALLQTRSAMHSGGDVWMVADGPGSEAVRGFLDNTDIFRLMADTITNSR